MANWRGMNIPVPPQYERFLPVWEAMRVAKQSLDAALIAYLDAESEGCARACDEVADNFGRINGADSEGALAARQCAAVIREAISIRIPEAGRRG